MDPVNKYIEVDVPFKIIDVEQLEQSNICHYCHKLLNVMPIYGLQGEDNTIKEACGRCLHVIVKHKGAKWKQTSYENMAKFITFPCRYKMEGCSTVLTLDKILNHETGCSKAILVCPLTGNDVFKGSNCLWKGAITEFQKHIEDFHGELFINPPLLKDLPKENILYFTHINKKLAIIAILIENNKYYSCIFMNESDVETQYYRYQVELLNESKTNSVILRKCRLEPYGNFQAILADKQKLLCIDLEIVEPMIEQNGQAGKGMSARFGIALKCRKDIYHIANANDVEYENFQSIIKTVNNPTPDENLLAELECPVCNEFMVPPIYICGNGHSLCNECLEKVQSCPNCRSSLEHKTRNFTVEKLTTKVRYPCKNREIGCVFITTSDKIREHENNCELADTLCILKCGEKFKKAHLFDHINRMHRDSVLQLKVVNSLNVLNRKENTFIISAYGEVFRLSIKTIMSAVTSVEYIFKLNVQHMSEDKDYYRYKFDFVDQTGGGLDTTIISTTQPLSEKPLKLNHITIPYHLIRSATKDRYVYYRINIYTAKRKRKYSV